MTGGYLCVDFIAYDMNYLIKADFSPFSLIFDDLTSFRTGQQISFIMKMYGFFPNFSHGWAIFLSRLRMWCLHASSYYKK